MLPTRSLGKLKRPATTVLTGNPAKRQTVALDVSEPEVTEAASLFYHLRTNQPKPGGAKIATNDQILHALTDDPSVLPHDVFTRLLLHTRQNFLGVNEKITFGLKRLAETAPEKLRNEEHTNLLISWLHADPSRTTLEKKKDGKKLARFGASLLYHVYEDSRESWPADLIGVHMEDLMCHKVWVEAEEARPLVWNIETAYPGNEAVYRELAEEEIAEGSLKWSATNRPITPKIRRRFNDETVKLTEQVMLPLLRKSLRPEVLGSLGPAELKSRIQRISATCGYKEIMGIAIANFSGWLKSGTTYQHAKALLKRMLIRFANPAIPGDPELEEDLWSKLMDLSLESSLQTMSVLRDIRSTLERREIDVRTSWSKKGINHMLNAEIKAEGDNKHLMQYLQMFVEAGFDGLPHEIAKVFYWRFFSVKAIHGRPFDPKSVLSVLAKGFVWQADQWIVQIAKESLPKRRDVVNLIRSEPELAATMLSRAVFVATEFLIAGAKAAENVTRVTADVTSSATTAERDAVRIRLRFAIADVQSIVVEWCSDLIQLTGWRNNAGLQRNFAQLLLVEAPASRSKSADHVALYKFVSEGLPVRQSTIFALFTVPLEKDFLLEALHHVVARAWKLYVRMPDSLNFTDEAIFERIIGLAAFTFPAGLESVDAQLKSTGTTIYWSARYWKACVVVILIACSSPSRFGGYLWNGELPSMRLLMQMCLTEGFKYPPDILLMPPGASAELFLAREKKLEQTDRGFEKALESKIARDFDNQLVVFNDKVKDRKPSDECLATLARHSCTFGLGTRFASCREPDFLLEMLQRGPEIVSAAAEAQPWLLRVIHRLPSSVVSVVPADVLWHAYASLIRDQITNASGTDVGVLEEGTANIRSRLMQVLRSVVTPHADPASGQSAAVSLFRVALAPLSSVKVSERDTATRALCELFERQGIDVPCPEGADIAVTSLRWLPVVHWWLEELSNEDAVVVFADSLGRALNVETNVERLAAYLFELRDLLALCEGWRAIMTVSKATLSPFWQRKAFRRWVLNGSRITANVLAEYVVQAIEKLCQFGDAKELPDAGVAQLLDGKMAVVDREFVTLVVYLLSQVEETRCERLTSLLFRRQAGSASQMFSATFESLPGKPEQGSTFIESLKECRNNLILQLGVEELDPSRTADLAMSPTAVPGVRDVLQKRLVELLPRLRKEDIDYLATAFNNAADKVKISSTCRALGDALLQHGCHVNVPRPMSVASPVTTIPDLRLNMRELYSLL